MLTDFNKSDSRPSVPLMSDDLHLDWSECDPQRKDARLVRSRKNHQWAMRRMGTESYADDLGRYRQRDILLPICGLICGRGGVLNARAVSHACREHELLI